MSGPSIRIGFYIPARKVKKNNFDVFIDMVNGLDDVSLVTLDPLGDLEAQGHFDVILFKITDELVASTTQGDKEAAKIVDNMKSYLAKHPTIAVIDPLDCQQKVLDRLSINEILAKVEKGVPPEYMVRMPRQISVEKEADEYNVTNLNFPVVCKTTLACGTVESHKMGIVFDEKNLHAFNPPFLAQEFYNHNATIFKVFVMGSKVSIEKRRSLPNLPKEGKETILFDSQLPFDTQLAMFADKGDKTDMQMVEEAIEPPMSTIEALAKAIKSELGLNLFGFDVITQLVTGYHAIVDVNYFPSYRGFPNFNEELLAFIKEKVKGHKAALQ